MAHYDYLIQLQGQSNMPEDLFVNTLHFEVNAPDTVGGNADEIEAAYRAFDSWGGLGKLCIIKAYAAGPPPRQPVFEKSYNWSAVGNGQSGPTEVACCLSYATVDDPTRSTARGRGRIYVGPLNGQKMNIYRPDSALRDSVLTLGDKLAAVGTASNTTWLMHSRRDDAYRKIEVIWCDDAWDIQRRRGLAPTLRQQRDVQ